jgi:hypothetical protein
MILIGDQDIATSILVIPCDKQPLYHFNVRPIPEGRHAILYGNFATQEAFARKCICCRTPCIGVISKDWTDNRFNAIVPMGATYEIYKRNAEVATELVKSAYGSTNIAVEAIQEHYQTNNSLIQRPDCQSIS